MNKKLFTSIDLTDFKKRFENSNDSNNKRYKEIVKKIVNDNEFPKDITFEEYRFIKKFLLLANKKSNTNKTAKTDEKDEKKEENEPNKTETKKKSYSSSTKSNNSSITTKSKSSSKKTDKKDSGKA